jgi:hypothetical protein
VGIIANPEAGKDVRRLVANALVIGDSAKTSIVRRAAIGAAEAGVGRVLVLADARGVGARALEGLDVGPDIALDLLPLAAAGGAGDTVAAAQSFERAGCGAVVVLGGDGTIRNVAQGWRTAPVVAVPTGTNNVFPRPVEATVAGAAAGLVAAGVVDVEQVSRPAKVIHVELCTEYGDDADLALVDAVVVSGGFTGSRALWDTDSLLAAVLAFGEADAVGLSAIGGLLQPCGREEDGAVVLRFGPGRHIVRAPIVPGRYADVAVAAVAAIAEGESVEITGPGVLALDGEREHVLGPRDRIRLTVRRDGPLVIDPARALAEAAARRVFVRLGNREETHAC